jgi:hypothetical protein
VVALRPEEGSCNVVVIVAPPQDKVNDIFVCHPLHEVDEGCVPQAVPEQA